MKLSRAAVGLLLNLFFFFFLFKYHYTLLHALLLNKFVEKLDCRNVNMICRGDVKSVYERTYRPIRDEIVSERDIFFPQGDTENLDG